MFTELSVSARLFTNVTITAHMATAHVLMQVPLYAAYARLISSQSNHYHVRNIPQRGDQLGEAPPDVHREFVIALYVSERTCLQIQYMLWDPQDVCR